MRKKLFERYVELNGYRLTAKQLRRVKLISPAECRAIETKIAQVEMGLIVPKRAKTHPRTLTRVK